MSYPEEVKKSIQIAQSLAKEYHHETFGPAHLMQALLHNEIGLASWLAAAGKDIHFMREWSEIRLESYPRSGRSVETPAADDKVKAVFELSELVAMQVNHDFTDAICVFAALLKPGVGFTADQLKTFPATQKEIMDAALEDKVITQSLKGNGTEEAASSNGQGGGVKAAALYKFCVDKTNLAAEGKLDPIIGRDKELRMMLEVLGRRTKPNVIIVGEPGVGKTALVDGFAQLLNEGKVPSLFKGAKLFELDTGALIAGASYKGEIEDRLKSILKELKQFDKSILFIDEIHLLLDSRGSIGTGAVNLLKPELARGELTLIGATTNEEYRKYIESDEAFSRRFELVRVEEPDTDATIKMLQRILPFYEKHHQLSIDDDAIKEAVVMAKRYAKDRRLPDSAVDLVDRTMAAIRMMGDVSITELTAIREDLQKLLTEDHEDLHDKLKWFHRELKDKVSPILVNKLESNPADDELSLTEVYAEYLKATIDKLLEFGAEKRESVTKNDVAAVISHKTGIPLGKIQSKEKEKLMVIEDVLKKRVVGQDYAVKVMSDSILESRSGLIKGGQPIGSFFLLGPTGTGKTELAKALADYLFNTEAFMIRFDMSEFKEEHSAALLYGAPPGYVGYEEGGMLVNKIREKPYSVVLFDEIEKAHPSVFDLFLQILDEGKLHDRLGKEGDFSNAIVLFTSNIGSEFVTERFNKKEVPSPTEMMEIMSKHFRPEFLARLTEIVPFAPISEDMAVKIFDIQLKSLTEPLSKQGISLKITAEAKKHLALLGFTPKYGARQIKGVIRNQLRRPISRRIVSGELQRGDVISLALNGGELKWDLVTEVRTEPKTAELAV
jgi:ATP-dependent Clp protease ATP-binding subunit ClpB